jgi:hypothetical protein
MGQRVLTPSPAPNPLRGKYYLAGRGVSPALPALFCALALLIYNSIFHQALADLCDAT